MIPEETTQKLPLKKTPTPSVFFWVIIIFVVGFGIGNYYANRQTADSNSVLHPSDVVFTNTEGKEKIDFSLFWKVWELLGEKYVGRADLDANKLFYGAIKGMLAASGDPYTTFFTPEEQKSFEEDISGIFEGIGAEMALRDGIVTVVAPLEGMPAEAAGVRAGDRVLKINGESTETMTLDQAVEKIRGPKDTEVKLTLYTEGEENTHEVSIQRKTILVKSVRYEDKGKNIALLRVSRFGDDTHTEFNTAIQNLQKQGAKGLILDLRNNPGGLLSEAVDLSGYFLPAGTTVVQEEDAQGNKTQLRAKGNAVFKDIPIVILINQGSASAAEILAGALRDNRENVRLVGETSFGKGSVQELIPVSKDTSVKITIARWLTPKGNQINQVGITPDEKVELTRDDANNKRDPQYDKAVEVLKGLMQ
jgi:carboxyl-terminal processing protease